MKDEDKHNEEMDKLFQGAFAQWEPKPEPAAWDKMEARLNRRRKKRVGILISAILLIGVVSFWYFWPDSKLNKEHLVTGPSNTNSAKQLSSNITTAVNSNSATPIKENNKQPIANTNTRVQSITGNNLSAEHQVNAPSAKTISNVTNTSKNSAVSNSLVTSTKKKNKSNFVSAPKSIAINNGNTTAIVSHKKNKVVSEKSTAVNQNVAVKSEITASETKKDTKQPTVTNNPIGVSDANETDMNMADHQNTESTVTLPTVKDTATSTIITAGNKAVEASSDLKQVKNQVEKNNTTETAKKDSAIQNAYAVAKKDSAIKQNNKLRRFSVSVYGSPEIGENNVTSTNAQFNIQDAKSTVRISAGAKLNIKLSDHFELNIGLSYSQYKQSNKSDSAWLLKDDTLPYVFATSLGNMSIPDSTMIPTGIIFFQPRSTFGVSYKYTETVSFINMPINAKYTFGNGKLRPYITAGLNLQYVLSENASLEVIRFYSSSQIIDKHFTYNSLDITRFNFGPSAGAGLEYILTDRFDIYLEPNARLNMLHFSGSANSTNYFIGCQAGVRIGL